MDQPLNPKSVDTRRLLHIACQLALVHIGDRDVLGKISNEALAILRKWFPEVEALVERFPDNE